MNIKKSFIHSNTIIEQDYSASEIKKMREEVNNLILNKYK